MRHLFALSAAAFLAAVSMAKLQAEPTVVSDHILAIFDISPDQSNFNLLSLPGTPYAGGRVVSLVVDPTNSSILYAATKHAGVWKSVTGAQWVGGKNAHFTDPNMTWFQASIGLRSGTTQNHQSLAIDAAHHSHLLYATNDNDGRPSTPLGGLWVSTNAAGSWSHISLPACNPPTIASVTFAAGLPFVSTRCGIFTTASATLAQGTWTLLPSGSGPPGGAFVVGAPGTTLLGCSGNGAFEATDLGKSGVWTAVAIGGFCNDIAPVPNGTAAPTQALVIQAKPNGAGVNQLDVDVVTFATGTVKSLGYLSRPNLPSPEPTAPNACGLDSCGSGEASIAAVAIPGAPAGGGPALSYAVYAGDSCSFYTYTIPLLTNAWVPLGSTGDAECDNSTTSLHADTWRMAFPSWYNPLQGFCGAYASTDGGVFFSGTQSSSAVAPQCTDNWRAVQRGLHVLESTTMTVITGGSKPFTKSLTEGIYLPTGDNDVFVTKFGSGVWDNLDNFDLGDAGQTYVDPAYPDQVAAARNGNYVAVWGPPYAGGSNQYFVGPKNPNFDVGIGAGAVANLAQILTPPAGFATAPKFADYLAVFNPDPTNCLGVDQVLRNITNPTSPGAWKDISPADHFNACNIGKIQASGGHGVGLTNVYMLTRLAGGTPNPGRFTAARGPGKIFHGVVGAGGTIPSWQPASGSKNPKRLLGKADDFFVNPYDPTELYAISLGSKAIKVSRDSGQNWDVDRALTNIATNHGEYSLGCNSSAAFQNACSLSGMAFDDFQPKVRLACMLFGGLAFSRDSGKHWMQLDVNDNNHKLGDAFFSGNLTQMVRSCFFDAETKGTKKLTLPIPRPDQRAYIALEGNSLRVVLAPFFDLESLDFAFTPKLPKQAHTVMVKILTPPFGQIVHLCILRKGVCHGSLLFDHVVAPKVSFQTIVDGLLGPVKTHVLTPTEISQGVATQSI